MVKLTLIGPPEEVAALVESMKTAVRVEVTERRGSRYSATDARWYAVAELLLPAERPRRIAVRGPRP